MTGSQLTYRDALTSKIKENQQVKSVLSKHSKQVSAITEEINALENEKRSLLKSMHKDHHSVDAVQDAIKDLEYRQKTSTHASAPEE